MARGSRGQRRLEPAADIAAARHRWRRSRGAEEVQLPERLECAEAKTRAADAAARERETDERLVGDFLEVLGALVACTSFDVIGASPATSGATSACEHQLQNWRQIKRKSRHLSYLRRRLSAKKPLGETLPDAASYFRFDGPDTWYGRGHSSFTWRRP
jgi:hypothetical protein